MPRIFASFLTIRKNRTARKANNPSTIFPLFLILISLSSCHKTINNLSVIEWKTEKFTPSLITNGRLAVLPVGQSEGISSETKWLGAELAKDLASDFGKAQIVAPDVVSGYLKDPSVAGILKNLKKKAAPDTVRGIVGLSPLGQKLHVRYLLQTDLRLSEVSGGAEHVRLFGRIWDTKDDEIIWTGYGEARGYVYMFFPAVPASFEKDAAVAVKGLVKEIERG
jgi:TolB-like protein